jgi:DNA polymerase-1
MPERETVLIFDGNNLAMRAVKAIEGRGVALSSDDGVNTGPLMLFIGLVSKYVTHVQPDRVAVAFDGGKSQRRLAIFGGYKANRSGGGGSDSNHEHFRLMKEWLSLVGIFHIQRDGEEADDLIGGYWRSLSPMRMVIVSGDKDLLQLTYGYSNQCIQIRPQQGFTSVEDETWTAERVMAEMGVAPASLPLFKALTGDTSDGIDGIPSVGPKRAAKILADCGADQSLRNLLAQPKANEHQHLVKRNYELINLRDRLIPDLPVPPPWRPVAPDSVAWLELVEFYERHQLDVVKSRMSTMFQGERSHG